MSDATINELQAQNAQLRRELADLRAGAEQTIQQAERRQDAFLSRLAHDLRNPLAPIHNALEILNLPNSDHAAKQRAVEIINGQTRDLRGLLNDILDFSRIICEKVDLKRRPVAVADVVAGAVAGNNTLIARRKQQLDVSLPNEPLWILGDAPRLTQAIAALVNNASKYTTDGGQIRISAAGDEAEVICRIADDGVGIEAVRLPCMFDLFAHAERSLDDGRQGLGIGLTMVRKLVCLHGGSVQALSDGPGRGSEFVIRLPRLADSERASAEALDTELHQGEPIARRILIVADEAFAEECGMLLRVAGHDSRSAHNALEALETARQFRPNVVAIDVDLRGLMTDELVAGLRKLPLFEKGLVIAILGPGREKNGQDKAAACCDAHLAKPVKIRDFLRLIAEKDALTR